MRVYLDNCCYNRPFDNKTQERVHIEAKAILKILANSKSGSDDIIIGSSVLRKEINNIKDEEQKIDVMAMYTQAVDETVELNANIINQAKEIMEQANIKKMDALHLSCAIFSNSDIFLTVDDKLIKACNNLNLSMRVINPINIGE